MTRLGRRSAIGLLGGAAIACGGGRGVVADRGPCPVPPPLPRCAPGHVGDPLAAVLREAPRLVGQHVAIDGPLGRGIDVGSTPKCDAGGCGDRVGQPVALAPADATSRQETIELRSETDGADVLRCAGEGPQQCCPVPVRGQRVIATGMLVRGGSGVLQLAGAALCDPEL